MMTSVRIFLVLSALVLPFESYAGLQIAAQGAADFTTSNYGFIDSPSVLFGIQITTDLGYPFQLGLAYEHNNISYSDGSGDGDLRFYGIVGRVRTVSPFFFDYQAGINIRDSEGPSFSWGVGAAYAIPLYSTIDFSPRIGYRFVPDDGSSRSMFDFGAMLVFKFI